MKKLRKLFFPLLLGLGLILGSFPMAHALETKSDEFTLEEITVTAEKREVNIQKTAMSVTAVTGDEISGKAVTNLQDALQGLAGVSIMGIPGGGQIYIRGVGSTLDANYGDPSVSVQLDNIYVGRVEAAVSSMYDVDRVEVLRGPQGTMYGRNAAGGQINVISKNPADKFEADASLTIGDYNLKKVSTSVNVPFSDKWSGRIAINRESRDGYISDGSDSADKFATRVKLSYKPTDKLSFLFTVEYTDDKSSAANSVPVDGSAGNLPIMGGTSTWVVPDADGDGLGDDLLDSTGTEVTGGNGIPDIVDTGWVKVGGDSAWTQDAYHPAAYGDNWFQFYQLQINYDMGWGKLYLQPALNKNKRNLWSNLISGTAQGETLQQQAYEESQWSGEARLQNSDNSEIKWLFGAYWLDSENKDANGSGGAETSALATAEANPGVWATQTYRRPTDIMAYYGQATYPVTDRFRVTGGIRYTADNRNMGYSLAVVDLPSTADTYYLTDNGYYDSGILEYKDKHKDITYRGGIEYDVNEAAMLYAYITTGYKAGGLNLQGVPITSFDPEELVSYSIGSKNRFMDGRLQVNSEIYYYDYDGYQIQCYTRVLDAYTGQYTNRLMTSNATKSYNSGLEIETDYMITANDKIDTTIAYMKAKYGSFVIPASPFYSSPFQLKDRDMANTPRYSGTIGYAHTFNLDDGAQITAKLQSKITAGYWTTHEQYYAGAWQNSYHMSDFYLTWSSPSGKYSAGLWGKNLENEAVTTRVLPCYRRIIMAPRTTGVTISAKF